MKRLYTVRRLQSNRIYCIGETQELASDCYDAVTKHNIECNCNHDAYKITVVKTGEVILLKMADKQCPEPDKVSYDTIWEY
jgi:hypothetical protein